MITSTFHSFKSSCNQLFLIVSLGCLLLAAGCSRNDQFSETSVQQESAATAGSTLSNPTPTAAAPAVIIGSVLETMDSGGYTYALIQTQNDTVWTAGPVTKIEVGQKVSLPSSMPMHNFPSKTLNRTFPTIYFVQSFGPQPASRVDQEQAFKKADDGMNLTFPKEGTEQGSADSPISGTQTMLDREVTGDFEKAPGGQTVAQIYADKTKLAGQMVKVRGIVVKFTPAIMGTNWLHLQDGTGDEGSHDLTVTTAASVKIGDLIMIRGVLAVDKDFGAGYRYQVIVEGAELITE